MSIQDLATLAGVPGLDLCITLLTATYSTLENIKVYKQQCSDMSGRCVSLMIALRDSSVGLEGTKAIELADEITMIVRRIDRKINEWAALSRLKSFLQQREIKDGIDKLHRDMDAAMVKFNVRINMELSRGYQESKIIQERDKAEIRDVLQKIVKSTDDMRALLSMQSSQPIEDIMESLQTELRDPDLIPTQEQTFREGLWILHEKTSKLPPLTDLTGQVSLSHSHTVAKGTFNDVFLGQWLDQEPVALRLPRTMANNSDVQKCFQREVTIWRTLDHPNVVPLYGIVYIGGDVYSVSPWMNNGTSISYVKSHPTVDRLRILSEVASGLEYLHLNGIVHGDLRGANILISKDGAAGLSDFGTSKFLEDCGQGMTSSPGVNPRWFAPELLRQTDPLSTHSDVWSFGMVCLELMTGEQPFSNISRDIAVLRELDQGKIPDRPGRHTTAQGLTDDLWSLMKKCWHRKPESRPSMTLVLAKLAEIRGLSSPGPLSPSKRRSIFSLRRPSTGETESTKLSNRLKMPLLSSIGGQVTEEEAQLSPIQLSPTSSSTSARRPSSVRSDGQNGNFGVVINSKPLHIRPTTSPNGRHEASPLLDTKSLHIRPSTSPGSRGGASPLLEVPSVSTSSPQSGAHSHRSSPSSDSYPSPKRSVLSSDSGIQISGPLKEAVADPKAIVNLNRSGSVSSGTLEGLVDRLINNSNLKRDLEYRDILFTCCTDFTTPEDLFAILARRFNEAEDGIVENPEDRVALQYNIFMVITYWLRSRHLVVDPQLLWQMRDFCLEAGSMKSSTTMHDKARDLMQLIDDRANRDGSNSALPLLPGRRIPRTSEILPRDLAIALTLLEGDKYRCILPTDYIAHLRRQPRPNNVEAAYLTNNKIVLWVKQSVLHYDAMDSRVQVLKFFINAARECRKLRNFSSLTAIAHALHSAPIDRLRLTKKELPLPLKHILEELDDILDPSANHRTYRAALRELSEDDHYQDACIPWIAVHLRELHTTLQKHPPFVEVDGHPLINFERYIRFTDRIKEVLHYVPPDLERYRQQGQLAYLDHQLRNVELKPDIDEELMTRSMALEAGETRDYRARKRELRRLGFRT